LCISQSRVYRLPHLSKISFILSKKEICFIHAPKHPEPD
jgi:hypothetical protein